jgi:hypothetical protein
MIDQHPYDVRHVQQVVLNAFRHQRMIDLASAATPARDEVCATPFGINERSTFG